MAQKLGEKERKRAEFGGNGRDNLCSSCNSPVMPLYHRTRPVFATLPAYIFVFVRSPARCLGEGNVPELDRSPVCRYGRRRPVVIESTVLKGR